MARSIRSAACRPASAASARPLGRRRSGRAATPARPRRRSPASSEAAAPDRLAPRPVDAQVAGDGVEPGRELGLPLPPGRAGVLGVAHHAQEHLLQQILRRLVVADEAAEVGPDRLFVTGQQLLEGRDVPGAVRRQELLVRGEPSTRTASSPPLAPAASAPPARRAAARSAGRRPGTGPPTAAGRRRRRRRRRRRGCPWPAARGGRCSGRPAGRRGGRRWRGRTPPREWASTPPRRTRCPGLGASWQRPAAASAFAVRPLRPPRWPTERAQKRGCPPEAAGASGRRLSYSDSSRSRWRAGRRTAAAAARDTGGM